MTNMAYTTGRVLLSILFVLSGVQKFMDVAGTAKMLEDKGIPIPDDIVPYLKGVPKYEALAYLAGGVEVIGGLMIMLGLKARWGAVLLLFFTAAATVLFHDFWNMSGDAVAQNQVHALKNLSIMGGLLLVVAGGSHAEGFGRRLP
jgi:putative oxidoreductase